MALYRNAPFPCVFGSRGRTWDGSFVTRIPSRNDGSPAATSIAVLRSKFMARSRISASVFVAKRSTRMLVSAWDDLPRGVQRSWKKQHRKTHYRLKAAGG